MPAHILDLPIEIFERIVLKGCEDEIDGYQDDISLPRRLKPFAGLVGRVCGSWRQLITSPREFPQTHFWIARLVLTADSDGNPSRFIRELSQFYRALYTTSGCDIAVVLGCYQVDGTIQTDVTVKLFIQAMHSIVPYQQQIILIHIQSHDHILQYCWQFLASQIREAPRLLTLAIVNPSTGWHITPITPTSFTTFPIPMFYPLLRISSRMEPLNAVSYSFSHLTSLDTLEIGDLAWLKEPTHTTTASRLVLRLHPPFSENKLVHAFRIHEDIASRLVSLEVHAWRGEGSSIFSDPEESPTLPLVTFRWLQRLILDVCDIIVEKFLGRTQFPSIETMGLVLKVPDAQDHATIEVAKISADTNLALIPVRPLKAVGILRLSSLDVTLPASPSSLAVLSRIQKTVADLAILILSDRAGEFSRLGQGAYTMQLEEEALLDLRPKDLELNFTSYQAIIEVMVLLDLRHIKFLTITHSMSYPPTNEPSLKSIQERAAILLTRTPKGVIPMDHLQSLNMGNNIYWNSNSKLPEYELLLSLLHAPTLEKVSLSTATSLDDLDFGQLDAMPDASYANLKQPHSFPLANSLNFALKVPTTPVFAISNSLRRMMGWFPNARDLGLSLYGNHEPQDQTTNGGKMYSSTADTSDDRKAIPGYSAVVQCLVSRLFAILAPSEEECTPLVNLHTLSFYMELPIVVANGESIDQHFANASSEHTRMCHAEIIRLFNDRARMGAVELVLDGTVEETMDFGLYKVGKNWLNFRFRAVTCQSEMTDDTPA